ncbi:hypothetical protein D7V72_06560 [bacterium D16-36]|nr:hypothetical protein D7V72_06560 [bacterium D16-36]
MIDLRGNKPSGNGFIPIWQTARSVYLKAKDVFYRGWKEKSHSQYRCFAVTVVCAERRIL